MLNLWQGLSKAPERRPMRKRRRVHAFPKKKLNQEYKKEFPEISIKILAKLIAFQDL